MVYVVKVIFNGEEREYFQEESGTIRDFLHLNGYEFKYPCGKGKCEKCKFLVNDTEILGCTFEIGGDLVINLDKSKAEKITALKIKKDKFKSKREEKIEEGSIQKVLLRINPYQVDEEYITDLIKEEIDVKHLRIASRIEYLKNIAEIILSRPKLITCVFHQNELLSLDIEDTRDSIYGVSVHILKGVMKITLVNIVTNELIKVYESEVCLDCSDDIKGAINEILRDIHSNYVERKYIYEIVIGGSYKYVNTLLRLNFMEIEERFFYQPIVTIGKNIGLLCNKTGKVIIAIDEKDNPEFYKLLFRKNLKRYIKNLKDDFLKK